MIEFAYPARKLWSLKCYLDCIDMLNTKFDDMLQECTEIYSKYSSLPSNVQFLDDTLRCKLDSIQYCLALGDGKKPRVLTGETLHDVPKILSMLIENPDSENHFRSAEIVLVKCLSHAPWWTTEYEESTSSLQDVLLDDKVVIQYRLDGFQEAFMEMVASAASGKGKHDQFQALSVLDANRDILLLPEYTVKLIDGFSGAYSCLDRRIKLQYLEVMRCSFAQLNLENRISTMEHASTIAEYEGLVLKDIGSSDILMDVTQLLNSLLKISPKDQEAKSKFVDDLSWLLLILPNYMINRLFNMAVDNSRAAPVIVESIALLNKGLKQNLVLQTVIKFKDSCSSPLQRMSSFQFVFGLLFQNSILQIEEMATILLPFPDGKEPIGYHLRLIKVMFDNLADNVKQIPSTFLPALLELLIKSSSSSSDQLAMNAIDTLHNMQRCLYECFEALAKLFDRNSIKLARDQLSVSNGIWEENDNWHLVLYLRILFDKMVPIVDCNILPKYMVPSCLQKVLNLPLLDYKTFDCDHSNNTSITCAFESLVQCSTLNDALVQHILNDAQNDFTFTQSASDTFQYTTARVLALRLPLARVECWHSVINILMWFQHKFEMKMPNLFFAVITEKIYKAMVSIAPYHKLLEFLVLMQRSDSIYEDHCSKKSDVCLQAVRMWCEVVKSFADDHSNDLHVMQLLLESVVSVKNEYGEIDCLKVLVNDFSKKMQRTV